jgi:hypothetical protein
LEVFRLGTFITWLKKLRDEGLFTAVWEACVLTLPNSVQEVANVLVDILKPDYLQIQEEHSQLSKPPWPNLSNYRTIVFFLVKQKATIGNRKLFSGIHIYKKVSCNIVTGKACRALLESR